MLHGPGASWQGFAHLKTVNLPLSLLQTSAPVFSVCLAAILLRLSMAHRKSDMHQAEDVERMPCQQEEAGERTVGEPIWATCLAEPLELCLQALHVCVQGPFSLFGLSCFQSRVLLCDGGLQPLVASLHLMLQLPARCESHLTPEVLVLSDFQGRLKAKTIVISPDASPRLLVLPRRHFCIFRLGGRHCVLGVAQLKQFVLRALVLSLHMMNDWTASCLTALAMQQCMQRMACDAGLQPG